MGVSRPPVASLCGILGAASGHLPIRVGVVACLPSALGPLGACAGPRAVGGAYGRRARLVPALGPLGACTGPRVVGGACGRRAPRQSALGPLGACAGPRAVGGACGRLAPRPSAIGPLGACAGPRVVGGARRHCRRPLTLRRRPPPDAGCRPPATRGHGVTIPPLRARRRARSPLLLGADRHCRRGDGGGGGGGGGAPLRCPTTVGLIRGGGGCRRHGGRLLSA